MTLVLNDDREVLLMYRHRWIIDQWVWELPGGYVDHAEDVADAAAREVEEETSWRPRSMQHLVTYQPAVGTLDQPQEIYLARGADLTETHPDMEGRGDSVDTTRWRDADDRPRSDRRRSNRGRYLSGTHLALADAETLAGFHRGIGGADVRQRSGTVGIIAVEYSLGSVR